MPFPLSRLGKSSLLKYYAYNEKFQELANHYTLIDPTFKIAQLKLFLYEKVKKRLGKDIGPYDDYFVLTQNNYHGFIYTILDINDTVSNHLKPGIGFRLQLLSHDEARRVVDPQAYQIFFCYIDKDEKPLGESFLKVFNSDATIGEMKQEIMAMHDS